MGCGHGWRVRGRQARGSKTKQEVVSNRLLAAHDGDGTPPEKTCRVQEMLGRDVVEGLASAEVLPQINSFNNQLASLPAGKGHAADQQLVSYQTQVLYRDLLTA